MVELASKEDVRDKAGEVRPSAQAKVDTQVTQSRPGLLLILLAAGVVVRFVVWRLFAGSEIHIADAQDYDRLAVGLAQTGNYLTAGGELSSLRPPFYPWLVSLSYQVFGVQNYEPVRIAQALLSLLNVVVIYDLGRRVFRDRVGLLAAALFCFYPTMLGFNNLILSETLFTLLLTLCVWFMALSFDKRAIWWLLPAGVAMGLGALTRSVLWLSLPFVLLLVVASWPGNWLKRGMASMVLLAAFASTIAPWAYRNTRIQKTFTLIDVMGGRNVMMGNYEHTPLERSWATIDTVKGEETWISVLIKEQGKVAGLTQGQIDKLAMRHGLNYMISHPVRTLQRTMVRFFNFWQLDRTFVAGIRMGYWLPGMSTGFILLMAVGVMGYYAVLAYAGIVGMFVARPTMSAIHYLMLLNVAIPCLAHSLIFAHSRYHSALMPLIVIYAACGMLSLTQEMRTVLISRGRLAAAVGVCILVTLGWVREIVMVDLLAIMS